MQCLNPIGQSHGFFGCACRYLKGANGGAGDGKDSIGKKAKRGGLPFGKSGPRRFYTHLLDVLPSGSIESTCDVGLACGWLLARAHVIQQINKHMMI